MKDEREKSSARIDRLTEPAITNPEMTKKTSTPMKPEGRIAPAW
jgi:hypothetical protein